MEIGDFYNGTWSIFPEKLDGLVQYFHENQQFIQSHMTEFQGLIKSRRKTGDPGYAVTDGVAIIPIMGSISKRVTIWSIIFGGAAVESIAKDFKAAMYDSQVSAIVLDIDSPGGTIGGLEGLAALVYDSRDIKPTVSYANGMMASAAYWIGSAATSVIAEKTASIGSIGVMTVHHDYSKADENAGVKTTYLSAGKYKSIGNDSEPLSAFAKECFQERLDYFYSMFVDTVAKNRNVSVKKALSMADGKVFIGQQALDAGLVDGIGQLDDAVELAASMRIGITAKTKNIARKITGGIKNMITTEKSQKAKTFEQLCIYFREDQKQSKIEAMKSAMLRDPAAYQDYLERAQTGEDKKLF